MADELVLRSLETGVLTLTLNRPERNNAWMLELEEAYFDALADASADPEVRAIVVTGAGKSFCPGMDTQSLERSVQGQTFSVRDRRPMTFALLVPKPIVVAINGACAGIGLIQASCADVRFAARGANFTTAFARRGLPAENSISWLLPRLIGHSRAADLLISARKFDADEALELGFVKEVVEPDQLLAAAQAYALDLATNVSPLAMATIKAQLYADWEGSREASRQFALGKVVEMRDLGDFKEGVTSYVERRPARFDGLSVPLEVATEHVR
jgi:enoyl-CoA hydratase/carnithine racemase